MTNQTERGFTPDAAKGEQIVHHFLEVENKAGTNWGTSSERPSRWDIPDTTTYINGVMVTIDNDYEMAYLLEVCDRNTPEAETWVTHLVLEVHAFQELYAWSWLEHNPYRFFDRPKTITNFNLYDQFINWYECNQEQRREQRT